MKTLYIERSTGECRNGNWVDALDLSEKPSRIVVGIGPGSFAGIRSALGFAQGYAIGSNCEVLGLPSACALVEDDSPLAVIGDARQGKFWIALFDGFKLITDIFETDKDGLGKRVPRGVTVVSPDDARIAETLKELFGDNYKGLRLPTAEGLQRFVERNPAILRPEPLPIYLNPAVR